MGRMKDEWMQRQLDEVEARQETYEERNQPMLTDSALKIIIILLWVGMLTALGFHHTN